MRDRLIELFRQIDSKYGDEFVGMFDANFKGVPDSAEFFADHLLAEGVIVPPCKVGDIAYTVLIKQKHINSSQVVGFHLGKFPTLRGQKRKEYLVCYSGYSLRHIDIDKIGKTVFFTREEAEKALAERSKG